MRMRPKAKCKDRVRFMYRLLFAEVGLGTIRQSHPRRGVEFMPPLNLFREKFNIRNRLPGLKDYGIQTEQSPWIIFSG
jgi:hypothetical protein